jgi:hypothetical protein
MVSTVLEMLDEKGTPRLRMASPYVVEAEGKRHAAEVEVSGCSYARSGKPPWGQPVTAPGSTSCDVRVAWSGSGAAYPLIVDPAWTTTGSLAEGRVQAASALLTGPPVRVLVVGGSGAAGTAEIYDVASKTWGAAAGAAAHNTTTVAAALASGRILFVGNGVAQLYDPVAATFTPTAGAPKVPRLLHTGTLLNSGKVLFVGGTDIGGTGPFASAELYDPTTNSFVLTGSMGTPRMYHAAVKLASGRVLVMGGSDDTNTGHDTAEIYDPTAGTFAPVANPMTKRRWQVSATLLGSGKVLIVGDNYNGGNPSPASAELFDPSDSSFTTTGSLHTPMLIGMSFVAAPSLTVLPNGGVLAVHQTNPELYDPATGTFLLAGTLPNYHFDPTATLLPGGTVLIAGGGNASFGYVSDCDLFTQTDAGSACTAKGATGECESLVCNGGVCCSGACDDPCKTCEAGTGTCLAVTGADDPDSCNGQQRALWRALRGRTDSLAHRCRMRERFLRGWLLLRRRLHGGASNAQDPGTCSPVKARTTPGRALA